MGIKIGNTDISSIKIASGLSPRLPSAYQEVEWIQSSGTQYIDTEVKASNSISTELVMRPNTSYVSEYAILGDAWSASALFLMEYNGKYRLHNGGNYGDFATVTDAKTTITTDNTGITINGVSYTLNAGSSYSNNNIWLFATGDGSNTGKRGRFKVYSFKIYSSGTLTRDFVPCYEIATSIIGLYDLVNDVFYTNSGTGTFSKGDDVNIPYKNIKKVYLGSTQVRPTTADAEFDITATLSQSVNYYNLNLTGIPTKIELTYTSNHASGWSDQAIGVSANNDFYGFNCGDGSNFNYNRCWLCTNQNGTDVSIVQDKYQATGTWQTVLTLEVSSCSVQQGNAATVTGTPNASQQTAISGMFADYTNLSLHTYGTNSTLTSDVHVKVRY